MSSKCLLPLYNFINYPSEIPGACMDNGEDADAKLPPMQHPPLTKYSGWFRITLNQLLHHASPDCYDLRSEQFSVIVMTQERSHVGAMIGRPVIALSVSGILYRAATYLADIRSQNSLKIRFKHLKNGGFWNVTPCGSCKNRRFGGT
jgi:hypothetical protein